MSLFEYIAEKPNTEIWRKELPDFLKSEISGKQFSKILNDIGFKGEILKAFFPKRSKTLLVFQPTISQDELVKKGIRMKVFIQELQLAHAKNNPD
ncbi:Uncharacterised protein [uncultured archaeon]|nr:Uncharacterised protein [uncultured archaeon]